jgi:hypothetical protein
VVALIRSGATQREAGLAIGVSQPIVQQALALDAWLRAEGRTDPYAPLRAPPTGRKYHQCRHPSFRFRPLDGFPRWPATPAG